MNAVAKHCTIILCNAIENMLSATSPLEETRFTLKKSKTGLKLACNFRWKEGTI